MMSKRIGLAVLAIAFTCGVARAVPIVTNGGFETGSFSGWSVGGIVGTSAPVVIQYNSSAQYPNGAFGDPIPVTPGGGNYVAYFSTDFGTQSISQTVVLTPGTAYTISYNLFSPSNGQANPFNATLSSGLDGSTLGPFNAQGFGLNWVLESATFVANGATPDVLSISFTGDGEAAADFAIDNIAVTAVPEASTWAMMILGFLGIAFVSYRHKSNRNSVALNAA